MAAEAHKIGEHAIAATPEERGHRFATNLGEELKAGVRQKAGTDGVPSGATG
jgi:hypothetical protein